MGQVIFHVLRQFPFQFCKLLLGKILSEVSEGWSQISGGLNIFMFNFPQHIIFRVVVPVKGAAVRFRLFTDISDRHIIVSFDVESEAYQALTELRKKTLTENYVVSQAVLAKNNDGKLDVIDSFDTGVQTHNDTRMGGLLGALLGVAGGPLGMVLMGGYGALIGSAIDWGDAAQNASLMEHVLGCVTEDSAVLIAVVQENDGSAFDKNFEKFQADVTRFDAAEVAAEIAQAQRVQEEMAREAKKQLREAKKQDRKQAIEERRKKISEHFSEVKAKFKK